jgi:hypothetical protein
VNIGEPVRTVELPEEEPMRFPEPEREPEKVPEEEREAVPAR